MVAGIATSVKIQAQSNDACVSRSINLDMDPDLVCLEFDVYNINIPNLFSCLFRWRTKQNLDYSFLMMYAVNKGVYYVQVSL